MDFDVSIGILNKKYKNDCENQKEKR